MTDDSQFGSLRRQETVAAVATEAVKLDLKYLLGRLTIVPVALRLGRQPSLVNRRETSQQLFTIGEGALRPRNLGSGQHSHA